MKTACRKLFPLARTVFLPSAAHGRASARTAQSAGSCCPMQCELQLRFSCCCQAACGRHVLQYRQWSRGFEGRSRAHDRSMLPLWSGRRSPICTCQAAVSRLYDETIKPALHSIENMLPAIYCAKETGWLSDRRARGHGEYAMWALFRPHPALPRVGTVVVYCENLVM